MSIPTNKDGVTVYIVNSSALASLRFNGDVIQTRLTTVAKCIDGTLALIKSRSLTPPVDPNLIVWSGNYTNARRYLETNALLWRKPFLRGVTAGPTIFMEQTTKGLNKWAIAAGAAAAIGAAAYMHFGWNLF